MLESTEATEKAEAEEVNELDKQEMEMFCEFCYRDGKQSQLADAFCVECVIYFCATCLKYHEKFHPNHTQQGKGNMPQDFYKQTCSQHSDELIKFYCLSCESTACSTCKVNYHQDCQEIHHLPKLVKEFDKIKEFVDIKNAIEEAEKEMDDIEQIVDSDMAKIKQYNNDAKHALNKDRKEINEIFDEMEKEADEVESMNSSKLEMVEGKITIIRSNVKTLKSDMENTTADLPRSEVFVAAKAAKVESNSILNNLQDARTYLEETEISKYVYVPAEKEPRNRSHGKLMTNREREKHHNVLVWSLVVIISALMIPTALFHFEASAKSHEIKLSFIPQQLCYTSKDQLLTIAFSENTVHIVNTTDSRQDVLRNMNSMSTYIGTSITTVADNKAAVMSSDGYIALYDVQSGTTINKNRYSNSGIYVRKNGQHIVYSNDTFYILYGREERHIERYDLNGNLLTNIALWNKFQVISPWNFVVSPNNNTMYITDSDLVIMLAMDGTVQGIFRHIDLIRPTGITIDAVGNLYVCGYLSDNVFKISPDFSHGYELLGKRHGLDRPFSIAYNEKEKELSVGSFGRKSIQVFKLGQTWFQYIRSLLETLRVFWHFLT